MKRAILFLTIILTANATNAATTSYHTNGYYRSTPYSNYYTSTPKHEQTQTENNPTRFYISAKGGYNLMYGSMYTDDDNNEGLTFSADRPIFSGTLGIDLNRDPSLRLELELANVAPSKAKFDHGWDSKLHADVGYTSYMLNVIPYFKATDTMDFDIILGLGAASVDFTDTDHDDFLYLQSGKIAFAAKVGIGLDIALTDNFSILPEVQYNLLVTTVFYGCDK